MSRRQLQIALRVLSGHAGEARTPRAVLAWIALIEEQVEREKS